MTNGSEIAPLAVVYRGESVEAVHYGSVAVVGADGKLSHFAGDPYFTTMTRSSIKPFQAMPLVMTGAADHFGFSQEQIAITCGSHNGSDRHREVVLRNLQSIGCTPEHLQCGCHWPIGMEQTKEFPRRAEERDPLRHNCSGKHSGFLALAKFLDEPLDRYLDPGSKIQTLVKQTLAAMCDYPEERMPPAIDGCSAPNYPLPLYNLALGFKRLAGREVPDEKMREAAGRIRDAMAAHPDMVSGEARLDFDIARSFPGNIVCKIGAEGIEGLGLSDPPLGIAIKIYDGSWRAMGAVVVAVLRQLGVIRSLEEHPYLTPHESPDVRNARNTVTGRLVADAALKRV